MNRPPIGYRVKIRRNRPRVIIFVMIIIIGALTIYIIKPDLNKLKDLVASYDKNEVEELPVINKSNAIIQVNETGGNIPEIIENPVVEEPEPEDYNVIEENIDSSSKEDFVRSSEIKEKNEIVNHSSSNVSEDTKSDSNSTETEKNYFETENLRSASDEFEEDAKLEKNTNDQQKEKYYIIISSVESKEAAEKQQKKFQTMAINTDVIFVSSKRYRISLGTYSSFKEASAKSKSFQSKHPAYKTWVWKVLSDTKK